MAKKIENKETKIKKTETDFFDAFDLFETVINSPIKGGIVISEMKKRIKILDAIEASDRKSITIDDADVETLKDVFNNHQWPATSKDVIAISDYLEEISKQK